MDPCEKLELRDFVVADACLEVVIDVGGVLVAKVVATFHEFLQDIVELGADVVVVIDEMRFLEGRVEKVDIRVPCKVVGIDGELAVDVILDAGIQLEIDFFPVCGED